MSDLVKRIAEQARYQYMPAETRAVLDEAAEEIKRLREALGNISRMHLYPDHAVNQVTLTAAIKLARAALRSRNDG